MKRQNEELDEKLYVSPTDKEYIDFDASLLLKKGEGDEEEER